MDLTLYTVPLYKVHGFHYIESDDVLTNGVADNWVKITDQIHFHWFPAFNEVVVVNYTFVPVETRGTARTKIGYPTSDTFNLIATNVANIAMSLTSSQWTAASTLGMQIK